LFRELHRVAGSVVMPVELYRLPDLGGTLHSAPVLSVAEEYRSARQPEEKSVLLLVWGRHCLIIGQISAKRETW
jgi:hypothetical protein